MRRQSYTHALEAAETLQFSTDCEALVPSSLSSLTCLTRLELAYDNSSAEFELGCLACLPSLQCVVTSLHVQ